MKSCTGGPTQCPSCNQSSCAAACHGQCPGQCPALETRTHLCLGERGPRRNGRRLLGCLELGCERQRLVLHLITSKWNSLPSASPDRQQQPCHSLHAPAQPRHERQQRIAAAEQATCTCEPYPPSVSPPSSRHSRQRARRPQQAGWTPPPQPGAPQSPAEHSMVQFRPVLQSSCTLVQFRPLRGTQLLACIVDPPSTKAIAPAQQRADPLTACSCFSRPATAHAHPRLLRQLTPSCTPAQALPSTSQPRSPPAAASAGWPAPPLPPDAGSAHPPLPARSARAPAAGLEVERFKPAARSSSI